MVIIAGGIIFFVNQNPTPPSTVTPAPVVTPEPAPAPTPAPATIPTPPPVSSTAGSHTISIQNFSFSQSTITIKKGDTVVWTNNDAAPHTVTNDAGSFGSDTLNTDQSYTYTFDTAGTFAYHCKFHPSMTGTVVVTE